ncbi:MAG: hypothetical protein Kow0097_04830 [Candidatus Bipolaricaulota bacterium]
MRSYLVVFLLVVAGGVAQGMSLSGSWGLTLELLPNTRIYSSDLTLNWGVAPGWRVESESKVYSDGLLRYQNFYLSGGFGDFGVWGKIYFHAQEVRYQKAWVNAEIPLGGGTFRSSFNHWASSADYSSSDRDMFGPWPCVPPLPVVSWQDAWMFMAQEVQVTGQVMSASRSGTGPVYVNVGQAYPHQDRFQIYIPSANVSAFEAVFGTGFWDTWNTEKPVICVRGTIKGYRYTSGGPGNGGYSVAEVSITSPSALSLGACAGTIVAPSCPGTTIRWFEAKNHEGQTVYVQGPVASISGPGEYYGYANHYRVRIGGGATVGNRVEVIMPAHPGWSTTSTSYSNEVCVEGAISVIGGVAVILPPDLTSTSGSPCCTEVTYLTSFLNWRFRYTLAPWTVTVDFGDCCSGFSFRQLSVAGKGLSLCCGLTYDVSLWFTKGRGLESVGFSLKDLPLFCCGLTADLSVTFAPDLKSVSLEPKWPGTRGCLSVYGDALWENSSWNGIVLYGFRIYCWLGEVRLEAGTAFDREKMNSVSPLSFRSGEWEYLGLAYRDAGCCGGDLWFNADLWFGDGAFLGGLRRLRLSLEVPVMPDLVLFTRGMIDLSRTDPLEYWDIGGKFSF